MRRRVEAVVDLDPERAFAIVGDLPGYGRWMGLVDNVTPAEPEPGDPGPAWDVVLRAGLGPFSRAKRLRMVRDLFEAPRAVGFTRRETDGRSHSAWELRATVEPSGSSSRLLVELFYDGSLFEPVVARALDAEIEASRMRLAELAEAQREG